MRAWPSTSHRSNRGRSSLPGAALTRAAGCGPRRRGRRAGAGVGRARAHVGVGRAGVCARAGTWAGGEQAVAANSPSVAASGPSTRRCDRRPVLPREASECCEQRCSAWASRCPLSSIKLPRAPHPGQPFIPSSPWMPRDRRACRQAPGPRPRNGAHAKPGIADGHCDFCDNHGEALGKDESCAGLTLVSTEIVRRLCAPQDKSLFASARASAWRRSRSLTTRWRAVVYLSHRHQEATHDRGARWPPDGTSRAHCKRLPRFRRYDAPGALVEGSCDLQHPWAHPAIKRLITGWSGFQRGSSDRGPQCGLCMPGGLAQGIRPKENEGQCLIRARDSHTWRPPTATQQAAPIRETLGKRHIARVQGGGLEAVHKWGGRLVLQRRCA